MCTTCLNRQIAVRHGKRYDKKTCEHVTKSAMLHVAEVKNWPCKVCLPENYMAETTVKRKLAGFDYCFRGRNMGWPGP